MLKIWRLLAAVVGVVAVIGGGAVLIPAAFAGRLPAEFGAIAILGLIVAMGCWTAYRKLGEAIRAQEAAELEQLRDISRFEVSGAPKLVAVLTLLVAGTGAQGVYQGLVRHDWPMLAIGTGILVVFGWFFARAMAAAMRNRPMMTMDLQGIDHLTFGRLPWSEVIGIRLDVRKFRNRKVYRLMIGLRSPHRYVDQLPWLMRWQKRAWRTDRPRYGAIAIPLNMMGKRPEVITEAAQRLRARNPAPWLEHWHEEFSVTDIDTFLATQEDMRVALAAADRGEFVAAEASARRIHSASAPMIARAEQLVKRGKRNYLLLNVGLFALAIAWIVLKVMFLEK